MHVQIKHSLAHLQDLIRTMAGIKYIAMQNTPAELGIKSNVDVLKNALFIHVFGFDTQQAIQDDAWIFLVTGSSWLLVYLHLLRSLLPFSNTNFYTHLVHLLFIEWLL